MNREILFRGKTKEGEWIEGLYVELPDYENGIGGFMMFQDKNEVTCDEMYAEDTKACIVTYTQKQHPNFSNGIPLAICSIDVLDVNRETIGQYTNLSDKNRKKIFEQL